MPKQSYVQELEYLIINTLLPVFDDYYRQRGELPPYTSINPDLLKQIKKRKSVPRLFMPPQND